MEGTAYGKLWKSEGGIGWGWGGGRERPYRDCERSSGWKLERVLLHTAEACSSLCSGNEIENKQTSEMRIYFKT